MDYAHMLSKAEAEKYKSIRRSHSDYVAILKKDKAPLRPIETFRGSRVPILHICNQGHISRMMPDNIRKKHYCKKCSYLKTNINILHYKDTFMYKEELEAKKILVVPLEDYKGAFEKILHECLVCGNQYTAAPHNILRHRERCQNCEDIKIHNNYVQRVHSVNPDIEILSHYSRFLTNQKMEVRCTKCGYEWTTFSNTLYKHRECQQCGKVTNTVDESEFRKKLRSNNPHIVLLDEYNKATDEYWFLCKKCNHAFHSKGAEISSGRHSCIYCATTSNGELRIRTILENYNIPYIPQKTFKDCRSEKNYVMPFDFYLPTYNMLLEYNGIQHEKVVDYFGGEKQYRTQKENDRKKELYAIEHGYNFKVIWYKDFSRIEEILIKELKLGTAETAG